MVSLLPQGINRVLVTGGAGCSGGALVRAWLHTFGLLVPILKDVAGGPIPLYGDGHNVRVWLYVGGHVGGHGEGSYKQVVVAICALLYQRLASVVPHASLITPVIDHPGHYRRCAIDPTRISTELCWQPRHNFEQGLASTVNWNLGNLSWCELVRERVGYGGELIGLKAR
jgi:dTDP-glucose 4,6-dehydratase